ncbi:MAG: glutaredoxin family protein [archaeon]
MVEVIVYSTPTCPYCVMLKDWLKEKKVSFTDFNVAEDTVKASEMIEKTGQRGVPVTSVNGTFVVGFDKAKLSELLSLKE